jgi:ligand-binding sensor domain-containing protein
MKVVAERCGRVVAHRRMVRGALAAISVLLAIASAAAPALAEKLPFRRFSVQDGLAHGRVNSIYQDRRGYNLLATWEGLSRFD